MQTSKRNGNHTQPLNQITLLLIKGGALTPRRSAFPKDVQNPRKKSNRGLSRIEEVPNTPRLGGNDVEKGNSKLSSFEMSEPPKAKAKWGKKATRP
ncbi:hypothetical protein M7I_5230 [Glarea lozoyensis 74030]|uniref:Uncharacterized protein n=1 Tax=Glarea lozoyensis (strain ATCC 74030 / MF5533) TaxID=1104152 RepID=H0ERB1_GLAL7|nr:hypothetical protein M7I_5230 [Glarea lozoyensis 74030]